MSEDWLIILPSDALVTLVRAAEEDQVDVVMGHACFQLSAAVRIPAPALARCNRLRRNINYGEEPALWWGGGVVLCLFRRSFIVQSELYFEEDVSYGEDQIYLSKSLPRAERLTLVPRVVYHYRQRADSLSAPNEWPDSRWLEFGRWHRLSAQYRATYKPALNFFLRNGFKWRVAKLIAAQKTLRKSVFRQVLTDLSEAYTLLDLSDQGGTMPPGYSMPRVPKRFQMLLRCLQSGDLAAAEAELDYLSRNVGDEGMLGIRDKHLQKLWQDVRFKQH